MNRTLIKKRLKTLSLYVEKIDNEAKLANHLLGETIQRELENNQKTSDTRVKLLASKAVISGDIVSSSVLINKYCYGKSLEDTLSDLNEAMKNIEIEKARRIKEHQQLQGKQLSVNSLIEKCEQQLAELESKEESRQTDEWITSSFTKTKPCKRLSRNR